MTELTVLEREGKPFGLVAGAPAYVAREAHRRIVAHYCKRRALAMPLDVAGYREPYYQGAGGYQAIAGYRPPKEGAPWQLADGRNVIVSGVDPAGRVTAQLVKPWGKGGAPGFYPVELTVADLDGATVASAP